MKASLQQVLSEGDSKKVDSLKNTYRQYQSEPDFIENILHLIKLEVYQKAASWLLKHHVEQGYALTDKEVQAVADSMQRVYSWESRLHLLQSLPLISIPQDAQLPIEDFVRESLHNDNKFVHAWAIQGLYELSRKRPELEREVFFICEKALLTEAASVKARVRKILVLMDKT